MKNGKTLCGEIVYIGTDEIQRTGLYMLIEELKIPEVISIYKWNLPSNWK